MSIVVVWVTLEVTLWDDDVVDGSDVGGVGRTQVEKIVFVVFFAAERAKMKVVKICEAFGANRYPFPEDPNRQWQMKSEVGMAAVGLWFGVHREGRIGWWGGRMCLETCC